MNPNPSRRDIHSVVAEHQAELLALPGVTGVGVGIADGKEVIVVFVTQAALDPRAEERRGIPQQIGGYEIDVRPQIRVG